MSQKDRGKLPHSDRPVVYTKDTFGKVGKVILCLNGFDGTAVGILRFVSGLNLSGVALAAIEADDLIWFPKPLGGPRSSNEPFLSASLERIDKAVDELISLSFSKDSIHFLGFSQGACLILDYLKERGGGWGGFFALAGCLIGSDEEIEKASFNLAETPVFIGYGDTDVAIPSDRVHRSAEILRREGANVDLKVYPYTGHRINRDEADYIKSFFSDGMSK